MALVIVHGSVDVKPEHWEELMRLCLEHVERSRQEPGCISHAVHVDAEDPNRLVFFEEWESMEALEAHFRVPTSITFVEQAEELAAGKPEIRIFESIEAR
jgi:quinol monooxygenase YgiN